MWQKTVGSAFANVLLVAGRVRLVVSLKESFTKTEPPKLLVSLEL